MIIEDCCRLCIKSKMESKMFWRARIDIKKLMELKNWSCTHIIIIPWVFSTNWLQVETLKSIALSKVKRHSFLLETSWPLWWSKFLKIDPIWGLNFGSYQVIFTPNIKKMSNFCFPSPQVSQVIWRLVSKKRGFP